MPTNVVKSKADEKKWEEAKAQARKQGKGSNYAYIMSIYKSMQGEDKEDAKKESMKIAMQLVEAMPPEMWKEAGLVSLVKKIFSGSGGTASKIKDFLASTKGSGSWWLKKLIRDAKYKRMFPGRAAAEKLTRKADKLHIKGLQKQLRDLEIADEQLLKELVKMREMAYKTRSAPYFAQFLK